MTQQELSDLRAFNKLRMFEVAQRNAQACVRLREAVAAFVAAWKKLDRAVPNTQR